MSQLTRSQLLQLILDELPSNGAEQITADDLRDVCNALVESTANRSDDVIVSAVVAGTNITIDNTDPENPIVTASGGGGGGVSTITSSQLNVVNPSGPTVDIDASALVSATATAQGDATQALTDAGSAQGDATQALTDAASAQGDATQALTNSASAQGDATQALTNAASAQGDATQALTNSASAQGDATQALTNAASAQGDATQALTNAASAQAAADSKVASLVAGTNVTIDNTDPQNPVVSASGGGGGVQSVVAGTPNVTIDNTDPANPSVSVSQTTAGLLANIYFTADSETTTEGTFYQTNIAGKGSTASSGNNNQVTLSTNSEASLPIEFLGPIATDPTTIPIGAYVGFLIFQVNSNSGDQRLKIESYVCDGQGAPVDAGGVVGSLGFETLNIADSGIVDATSNRETSVRMDTTQGFTYNLAVGQRVRYVVRAEKVGGSGNKDLTLFSGSNYNSFFQVPILAPTVAYDQISKNGTELIKRTEMDFTGAGVTVTDDPVNQKTTINIPGGGGGGVSDLQGAYEGGSSISTSATFGPLSVSGTQDIDLQTDQAVSLVAGGAFQCVSDVIACQPFSGLLNASFNGVAAYSVFGTGPTSTATYDGFGSITHTGTGPGSQVLYDGWGAVNINGAGPTTSVECNSFGSYIFNAVSQSGVASSFTAGTAASPTDNHFFRGNGATGQFDAQAHETVTFTGTGGASSTFFANNFNSLNISARTGAGTSLFADNYESVSIASGTIGTGSFSLRKYQTINISTGGLTGSLTLESQFLKLFSAGVLQVSSDGQIGSSGQFLGSDGNNGTKWLTPPGGSGGIQSIVAGNGIAVDNTISSNPIVSSTLKGALQTWPIATARSNQTMSGNFPGGRAYAIAAVATEDTTINSIEFFCAQNPGGGTYGVAIYNSSYVRLAFESNKTASLGVNVSQLTNNTGTPVPVSLSAGSAYYLVLESNINSMSNVARPTYNPPVSATVPPITFFVPNSRSLDPTGLPANISAYFGQVGSGALNYWLLAYTT